MTCVWYLLLGVKPGCKWDVVCLIFDCNFWSKKQNEMEAKLHLIDKEKFET